MAAGHEDDFVKFAFRSFAMLDDCYGRPKRASTRHSQLPPPYGPPSTFTAYNKYKSIMSSSNTTVIDSNEAAKLYGGIVITEHMTTSGYKKVMDCNEAAQLYGGIVITEYGTKNKKQLQLPKYWA